MNTIGDRIKQIRQHEKMTQKEFGDVLKLTQHHISFLEKNKRNIQSDTVELINIHFGINKEWLLTGEGEMFIDPFESLDGPEHLKNLGRKLMSLPKDQYEKVIKMIETFIE